MSHKFVRYLRKCLWMLGRSEEEPILWPDGRHVPHSCGATPKRDLLRRGWKAPIRQDPANASAQVASVRCGRSDPTGRISGEPRCAERIGFGADSFEKGLCDRALLSQV